MVKIMADDLNKFESLGRRVEGCQTGQHLWDEREGHITVETDGDLTKVKLRCLVCGKQFDISVPLDLNKYINKPSQPQQIKNPIPTRQIVNNDNHSDILKRIL